MRIPVLHQLGQKIVIFRGFSNFFSELLDSNLNFLILIEFPNILHWKPTLKNQIGYGLGAKFGPNYVQCCEKSKETGNIIRFFSYFTWHYLLKQEAVVVKPPISGNLLQL